MSRDASTEHDVMTRVKAHVTLPDYHHSSNYDAMVWTKCDVDSKIKKEEQKTKKMHKNKSEADQTVPHRVVSCVDVHVVVGPVLGVAQCRRRTHRSVRTASATPLLAWYLFFFFGFVFVFKSIWSVLSCYSCWSMIEMISSIDLRLEQGAEISIINSKLCDCDSGCHCKWQWQKEESYIQLQE